MKVSLAESFPPGIPGKSVCMSKFLIIFSRADEGDVEFQLIVAILLLDISLEIDISFLLLLLISVGVNNCEGEQRYTVKP